MDGQRCTRSHINRAVIARKICIFLMGKLAVCTFYIHAAIHDHVSTIGDKGINSLHIYTVFVGVAIVGPKGSTV